MKNGVEFLPSNEEFSVKSEKKLKFFQKYGILLNIYV